MTKPTGTTSPALTTGGISSSVVTAQPPAATWALGSSAASTSEPNRRVRSRRTPLRHRSMPRGSLGLVRSGSVQRAGAEQLTEALVVVAEEPGEHVDRVLPEERGDAGGLGRGGAEHGARR